MGATAGDVLKEEAFVVLVRVCTLLKGSGQGRKFYSGMLQKSFVGSSEAGFRWPIWRCRVDEDCGWFCVGLL